MIYVSRWAPDQGERPARQTRRGPGVTTLGAAGALSPSEGGEPHLWSRDSGGRRRTGARSLLSHVPVDVAQCPAVDPAVAAAQLDRVCLPDPEAPVGNRGVPGAQRRRVLWASWCCV